MENLKDSDLFSVPGSPSKILRGIDGVIEHFLQSGVLRPHRGKYFRHRLTDQATMVMTSPRAAVWFLVRSRRCTPLSDQWAKIFADE